MTSQNIANTPQNNHNQYCMGERVGRRGMRAEVKVAVSTTVGIMEVHVRVFSH